ncbi:hypothetical protein AwWohl_03450 [Gammaproteobacteria bacterium]|nr:hypothetical protein AwWohl_03450 [Gammaproteobacteria bacterium]
MELIGIFAMVLSLSICLAINPYLSLLILSIVAKNGFAMLMPPSLLFITEDMFMVMLAMLAIINFFVDMTPGLDSAWDLFHTVIRVPLAALFTFILLTRAEPAYSEGVQAFAFCIGLGVGLCVHFGKSSLRAYFNSKSHLAYNWFASTSETILIIVLLALTLNFRMLSYGLSIPLIALALYLIKSYWRDFQHLSVHMIMWIRKRKGWREEDTFFD